jgi:hypothetical protein
MQQRSQVQPGCVGRICLLMDVSRSRSLVRIGLCMIVCAMPLACNRSGGGAGNSGTLNGSPTGSHDQPQNKQAGAAASAGQQNQSEPNMPADTVSGKPSTASDNGSPAAVADRSVAEPGAPEGTIHAAKKKATKGKGAPAAASPNP